MSDIFQDLNSEQKKAVVTTDGPILILAGAGSGKTKTITHRIAYLIQEKQINPEKILAVTFTNKAAEEMVIRSAKITKKPVDLKGYPFFRRNHPAFGTFHSICAKILRTDAEKVGYKQNFAIYDPQDQLKLIKNILKANGMDEKRNNPKSILWMISEAKNELKDEIEYAKTVYSPISEVTSKVYPIYQRELKSNNAFDFDDLMMKTVELFKKDKSVLNYYQDLWEYIHIDEYQDTNLVQYTLVKMLAEKNKNLCVVGDPDQSIYGWRGADIRNILNFEKDYSDITVIKLEQNYRSTKKILRASQEIITKNKNRKEKELWTENPSGSDIEMVKCLNERDEGNNIIRTVESAMEDNIKLRDVVVLYRTNAQSRSIEEACLKYAMPYKIIGGVKFYERKEIKDILAYLRIILNPDDNISLERVINVPARGVGKTSIDKMKAYASSQDISLYKALNSPEVLSNLTPKIKSGITKFMELVKTLSAKRLEMEVSDIIQEVIDKSGYKNLMEDDLTEGADRLENLQELLSVSQKYDYLEPELGLLYFMEEISLLTDADKHQSNEDKLTLMTMHSAKGLEFKYVLVAGAEESLFPHQKGDYDREQLEEERRLAYVSMTRAEERLFFFFCERRMIYGLLKYNEPSRFLYEIPEDIRSGDLKTVPTGDFFYNTSESQEPNFFIQEKTPAKLSAIPKYDKAQENVEFKDGDKIFHPAFGEGVIVSKNGDIASLAFKNHGIKKMALSIAPIKKI